MDAKVIGRSNVISDKSGRIFKFLFLVVGEVALLSFLLYCTWFQDREVSPWFHNTIGELGVFGSVLILLFISGLLPDFLRSFVYSLKEADEITVIQVKRSLLSVKLAMMIAVASQLLVLVYLYVSMVQNSFLAGEVSLVVLAAYGGNAIYGILAVIVLLPVYARLKVRLFSMQ